MLALQSYQRALDIRVKLFGEEHADTTQSYVHLGITQHAFGDILSALQSHQRALDIRVKLFGEEQSDTAKMYCHLAKTKRASGDLFVSTSVLSASSGQQLNSSGKNTQIQLGFSIISE